MLLLALCSNASAANWPWQNAPAARPSDYCIGFLVGGLASDKVTGMSRTALWLGWSDAIRAGALEQTSGVTGYLAGQAAFDNLADANAAAAVVQQTAGNCELGKTGHQITGW